MRSAFRGPAHQLAVRMLIIAPMAIIIIMAQATSRPYIHHAPATARAPRVCTLVPFIFLRKSDCLGCAVLLCLVVCLTLLASFFLPSHLSLKYIRKLYVLVYMFVNLHVHMYIHLSV